MWMSTSWNHISNGREHPPQKSLRTTYIYRHEYRIKRLLRIAASPWLTATPAWPLPCAWAAAHSSDLASLYSTGLISLICPLQHGGKRTRYVSWGGSRRDEWKSTCCTWSRLMSIVVPGDCSSSCDKWREQQISVYWWSTLIRRGLAGPQLHSPRHVGYSSTYSVPMRVEWGMSLVPGNQVPGARYVPGRTFLGLVCCRCWYSSIIIILLIEVCVFFYNHLDSM